MTKIEALIKSVVVQFTSLLILLVTHTYACQQVYSVIHQDPQRSGLEVAFFTTAAMIYFVLSETMPAFVLCVTVERELDGLKGSNSMLIHSYAIGSVTALTVFKLIQYGLLKQAISVCMVIMTVGVSMHHVVTWLYDCVKSK